MDTCPCGSGRAYESCCEPYIKGSLTAPTAEALMRSRYSAYVKGEIDYIVSSCASGTEGIDLEATKKWSAGSKWLGLSIHRVEKGGGDDSEGIVEFTARYEQAGLRDEHREVANFVKKDGKWLYDEGKVATATVVRAEPKVGRNDPCPCGSGKKYKKCCGAGA